MKKFLCTVMVLLLTISLFTGCGKKAESSSDETAGAKETTTATTEATTDTKSEAETAPVADEQITLRFSWWGGDERLEATLSVIEQFETLHPNIKIEPEYGSSDGYSDKLSTQLASGTAPDIIQIDPGVMPSFVTPGTDYFINYNDYGFDFSKFEEKYYTQRINGNFDGKQLGIPTGIAGGAMIVNQTLADAIGLDLSKQMTWNDLIEMGKKVREYDSSMYLLMANKDTLTHIILNNYLKQISGTSFTDEATKEINYTQEQLEQGYAFIQSLYDNEVVPPASYMAPYSGDNLQSDPNWIAGKYVCSLTYTSLLNVLSAANESVAYTAGKLPVLENATAEGWFSNCPQIIAVSSTSEHPTEAVMFLDYFFNNPEAMKTLGTVRSVPPTEEARQICTENGTLTKLLADAVNITVSYKGIMDDKNYQTQQARQIVVDEVEAVGYGVNSPADAATETLELMKNYLSSLQ